MPTCSIGANVQHWRQCAITAPTSATVHIGSRGATVCSLGANVKPWRQYAALAPTRRLPSHRRPSPIAAIHALRSRRRVHHCCTLKRARVFGYSRHNRRVMAPLVQRTPCVRSTWAPVGTLQPQWGRDHVGSQRAQRPVGGSGGRRGQGQKLPFLLELLGTLRAPKGTGKAPISKGRVFSGCILGGKPAIPPPRASSNALAEIEPYKSSPNTPN